MERIDRLRVRLVLCPAATPRPELTDRLQETERGEGGFGSSGAMAREARP